MTRAHCKHLQHLCLSVLAAVTLSSAAAHAGATWQPGPRLVDKATPYAVAIVQGDRAAINAASFLKRATTARNRYANLAKRSPRFARTYALKAQRMTRLAQHRAQQAVLAYEQAIRAKPKRAEPHLRAATVIYYHWFFRQPVHCVANKRMCLRVINHWHEFERKAPMDPRNNEFMFARALMYTTLTEMRYYKKAVTDYLSFIRSTRFTSSRDRGTTLGNLAEIYMMMGDVDKAIPMYKRALAEGNTPLQAYGLAVALDRDGRGVKAREVMLRYASTDRVRGTGRLKSLTKSGVFFVPDGEIHYYHALGYESQGMVGRAIVHYQKFLRSGAHPKFAARARENLKRLRTQLLKQFKKPPSTLLTPGLLSN